MPLGKDDAVVVRMIGMIDVVAEGSTEQQPRHQLRRRQRRRRMSGTGSRGGDQYVIADQPGEFLQVLDLG